ncbi:MAG TPA: hypothetical protein VFB88_20345, partial [Xanthobacteraceae bacterium]|nr:hypothetical protein [Xanthobacteraceae bacterium]
MQSSREGKAHGFVLGDPLIGLSCEHRDNRTSSHAAAPRDELAVSCAPLNSGVAAYHNAALCITANSGGQCSQMGSESAIRRCLLNGSKTRIYFPTIFRSASLILSCQPSGFLKVIKNVP